MRHVRRFEGTKLCRIAQLISGLLWAAQLVDSPPWAERRAHATKY